MANTKLTTDATWRPFGTDYAVELLEAIASALCVPEGRRGRPDHSGVGDAWRHAEPLRQFAVALRVGGAASVEQQAGLVAMAAARQMRYEAMERWPLITFLQESANRVGFSGQVVVYRGTDKIGVIKRDRQTMRWTMRLSSISGAHTNVSDVTGLVHSERLLRERVEMLLGLEAPAPARKASELRSVDLEAERIRSGRS